MNVETCPFIKVEDFFWKFSKFAFPFPKKDLRVPVFPLHMVGGEDEVDDDTHPIALSLHHPHPCNFHTQQIPLGIQCTNWGELDVALMS